MTTLVFFLLNVVEYLEACKWDVVLVESKMFDALIRFFEKIVEVCSA